MARSAYQLEQRSEEEGTYNMRSITEAAYDGVFVDAYDPVVRATEEDFRLSTDQILMVRCMLPCVMAGDTTRSALSGAFSKAPGDNYVCLMESLLQIAIRNRIRYYLGIQAQYEPVYSVAIANGVLPRELSEVTARRIFDECVLGYPAFRVDASMAPQDAYTTLRDRIRAMGVNVDELTFQALVTGPEEPPIGYIVAVDLPAPPEVRRL
jgi:hypothetical protein